MVSCGASRCRKKQRPRMGAVEFKSRRPDRVKIKLCSDAALTARELDVLRLVASGLGNKEIAADLGITTHTVKYHLAAVLEKLGVRSRTEAVSLGVRTGLVPL